MDNWDLKRLQAGRIELVERIANAQPNEGQLEIREGLYLNRISTPNFSVHCVLEPSCCVVAGGSKEVIVGDRSYLYGPTQYLIATMGLPAFARTVEATEEAPYLSLRFKLDPALITSIILESREKYETKHVPIDTKGIDVSKLGVDMQEAALRLIKAAESDEEYRIMGPSIFRELMYRLLLGTQAARLNQLARFGGEDSRMVKAVRILTESYHQPLRIDDIAEQLGMSVSSFHAHFKGATNLSPVQFQKQIRLQEAQRLMLYENYDAGQAAYRVGYEGQSHFNRDYKRQFGEAPMRNITKLKALSGKGFKIN